MIIMTALRPKPIASSKHIFQTTAQPQWLIEHSFKPKNKLQNATCTNIMQLIGKKGI